MQKTKIASLEIFNRKAYLMPVLSFIDMMVMNHSKLDTDRYQKFRIAVSEIIKTRIDRAYPGKMGAINVDLYLTDAYFEVSVMDKGIPGWQDFSFDKEKIAKNSKDLRNLILDMCVDGVGMEKLGKNGQRIYVRLNIKNALEFRKPQPLEDITVLDKNISLHEVRTEEDIIEAIRCIYSEYGYSYSYEGLYYVDTFRRMIENGEIISFLAKNDHGQTAGHFALVFSELFKNMPEISTVVIRKEFRGLDLFAKFLDCSIDVCKKRNVRAMMGQPVAYHPMSQKALLRAGFSATSLLLSYIAPDLESEYNKEAKRLSLCSSVIMFEKNAKSEVYAPKELESFFKKIYGRIGIACTFKEERTVSEHTVMSSESSDTLRMTKAVIRECGSDIKEVIADIVNDTIRRKSEMTELAILLNHPGCEAGYNAAKECGFNISGVIPGAENGDYLIMQQLSGDTLDYDNLVLVSEFEELRDDIVSIIKKGDKK